MRTGADRCALAAFALLALLVPPTLEFDFLPQNVLSGGGPASCHLPSGTPGKEEALISETLKTRCYSVSENARDISGFD